MSRLGDLSSRLYHGEVQYDFVGRRRRWYLISGVILLLAVLGVAARGLNLGIEFRGGNEFVVQTTSGTVEQARTAVTSAGVTTSPIITKVGSDKIRVQTETLPDTTARAVQQSLATTFNVPVNQVTTQSVGPTWGAEITRKAMTGLLFFLIAIVIFLSLYFEPKMAAAALVALIHDVVITVGIYALVGFEVTPATVVGVLTILGYSLYDTVVVFDKVKENTRGIAGGSRRTYSEAANLALNQTLARSINTSVIALLPVLAILIIGVGFLGAGTLKDLALALAVGMAAGTYSSIFVATPILAQLKEQEPAMQALARRVAQRRGKATVTATGDELGVGLVPVAAGATAAGGSAGPVSATGGAQRRPVDNQATGAVPGAAPGAANGGAAGAATVSGSPRANEGLTRPTGPRAQPRRNNPRAKRKGR